MNLARLYHTLKPLRAVQWTDRLLRPVKARLLRDRVPTTKHLEAAAALPQISLPRFITSDRFDPITGEATFLNISHRLDPRNIDWNFSAHGKLWTYHLNYFGWLEGLESADAVLPAMQQFCRSTATSGIGSEPYPASRRIQHWIGALVRYGLRDEQILKRLYTDAWRIARLPEYHLQANHLLQNGLAMFAAAIFFDDVELYCLASSLLRVELGKQFLKDGGHIERSASYTADLCARMLFCLQLQSCALQRCDESLVAQMRRIVAGMLLWLNAYAFSDGSLAAIGDSSPDMMPSLSSMARAAEELHISAEAGGLRESGYRKSRGKGWEAIVNVGSAAPSYQPGHSHADALTFCLHAYGKPLVVDTGISTYEQSERRLWERSTQAHNTVVAGNRNSSDVWSSFRMGRRANVRIAREEPGNIYATHDGYEGLLLGRDFDWRAENIFRIVDSLYTAGKDDKNRASAIYTTYLHFHPDAKPTAAGDNCWRAGGCEIHLSGFADVTPEEYGWAAGFNLLRPAVRLRCQWDAMETEIRFHF